MTKLKRNPFTEKGEFHEKSGHRDFDNLLVLEVSGLPLFSIDFPSPT
jgi:hypothetical protein